MLACTVHLHEDFLSPEHISLAVHALVFPAQVFGSPKHIPILSVWLGASPIFGKSQLKHE